MATIRVCIPTTEMIAKVTNTAATDWTEIPSSIKTNGVNWMYEHPNGMAAMLIFDQETITIDVSEHPGQQCRRVASFQIDLNDYEG